MTSTLFTVQGMLDCQAATLARADALAATAASASPEEAGGLKSLDEIVRAQAAIWAVGAALAQLLGGQG